MSGSSPHSIREALIPHSWEWKDDEEGATATSVHASECRRCAADAALDSLEEQIQAERDERFEVEVAASLLHEQLEAQEAVLRAYVGRFGLILPTDEPRAEVSFPASRQDA